MTPQQIIGMASRLFALWLVIMAFQIFGLASLIKSQAGVTATFAMYVMPVLPLLLAAFLWFFPMFIAHKLVPRTHDANALRMPAREATAAASAIIGIWTLINTLPHLVAAGCIVSTGINSYVFASYFNQDRTVQLFTVLFQVALGLFLVLKPWFVAGKIFPEAASANKEQL